MDNYGQSRAKCEEGGGGAPTSDIETQITERQGNEVFVRIFRTPAHVLTRPLIYCQSRRNVRGERTPKTSAGESIAAMILFREYFSSSSGKQSGRERRANSIPDKCRVRVKPKERIV
ncbi:hypothetical protein KM043_003734 [Ampulex compressa]|nr:hypothetical protein KM043_003734 [Ampulex compressa]